MHFQINGTSFPTLYAIAMDYIPIQASAVPCERVFSSSAETDTKRRNRISSLLMEALQMLKFYFKKERLNFTKNWAVSEKEMTEVEQELDLLAKLFEGNFQDGLDRVLHAVNGDDASDDSDEAQAASGESGDWSKPLHHSDLDFASLNVANLSYDLRNYDCTICILLNQNSQA